MIKKCLYCDKDIIKKKMESKSFFLNKRKYCSYECKNKHIPTKYWENKKMKGNRKIGWKMSEENKNNISKGHKGNKHGFWKGGTSRNYYKKVVLIRDDYNCQICGLRDVEIMEVDHIRPVSIAPHLVSDLTNLLTMCPNCHRRKTKRDRKIISEYRKELKITKT